MQASFPGASRGDGTAFVGETFVWICVRWRRLQRSDPIDFGSPHLRDPVIRLLSEQGR
jgi:hypothetical protein